MGVGGKYRTWGVSPALIAEQPQESCWTVLGLSSLVCEFCLPSLRGSLCELNKLKTVEALGKPEALRNIGVNAFCGRCLVPSAALFL